MGYFACFFDHTMSQWVILRGEFFTLIFGDKQRTLYFCIVIRSIVELCWGATPRGIRLQKRQAWRGAEAIDWASVFPMLRVYFNAKKNPQMNRLRFILFIPL